MAEEPRTALGSAHERFLRSLPERGMELRELVRRHQLAPADAALSEQVGRRLHTLYASAQVFQEQSLVEGIKMALAGIETSRLERRPPTPGELDAVLALCDDLPDGESGAPRRSSTEPVGHSPDGLDGTTGRPGDRPVAIANSVAGSVAAPELLAILVIAGAEIERAVRAALPDEHCELTSSADADTAVAVLERVAPDVVLIEAALLQQGGAAELVERLRGDRATASRAVIAIVPAHSTDIESLLGRVRVDAALRMPLPQSGLLARLQRWANPGIESWHGLRLARLRSGTVDEIARGVAEEIERGISGSLVGRGERIELADNTELLAATWSAIARIRAHLEQRAAGRVRFDDAPYAGGPSALALTESVAPAADAPSSPGEPLRGRRLLLADDDPAVLWFFSNLLREAGAIAIEARDGRHALELARRRPPDVVISDILMPEIDGFTLCRELKRDLALCHVPVILLSWKEDFLQRMRELDAGASGYLRKEAGSHQILATVTEVLRPRTELTSLLAAGGEVQGRIEPLGVPILLRTIAAARPDARIALRDAWNLFEIDLREGNRLSVTRTASDGSFARGHAALRQLLGVDGGRFNVSSASGPVRSAFGEPLDLLLADGLRQLGAVLDAVSDTRLLRVERIAFDDAVLGALLSATPTALADAAARLRGGEPPRALLLDGSVTPRDLEQQLRELARRGAIVSVTDANGSDMISSAREARDSMPGVLMHSSSRPDPRSRRPASSAGPISGAIQPPPQSPAPPQAPAGEPPVVVHVPVSIEPAAVAAVAEPQRTAPEPERVVTEPRRSSSRPPAADPAPFSVQSARLHSGPPRATPSQPPARTASWPRMALVALVVAGAVAVARWSMRHEANGIADPPQPLVPRPARAELTATAPSAPAQLMPEGAAGAPAALGPRAQLTAAQPERIPGFGRVLPFIDRSRGVSVADQEGLLVIEYEAGRGHAPSVRVGGRDLGRAPVATALPEGRHEIVWKLGNQTSFRYVVIRPGETRIVQIRD